MQKNDSDKQVEPFEGLSKEEQGEIALAAAAKTAFFVLVFGALLLLLILNVFPAAGAALYRSLGSNKATYLYTKKLVKLSSGQSRAQSLMECVDLSVLLLESDVDTYAPYVAQDTVAFLSDADAMSYIDKIDTANRAALLGLDTVGASGVVFSYEEKLLSYNAFARAYLGEERPYYHAGEFWTLSERIARISGTDVHETYLFLGQLSQHIRAVRQKGGDFAATQDYAAIKDAVATLKPDLQDRLSGTIDRVLLFRLYEMRKCARQLDSAFGSDAQKKAELAALFSFTVDESMPFRPAGELSVNVLYDQALVLSGAKA